MGRIALSAIICFFLITCKKSEDPAPVSITTTLYSYQPSFDGQGADGPDGDHWVFISDEQGNILDSKAVKSGELTKFTTTNAPPTKINVTFFDHGKSPAEITLIASYLGMKTGSSLVVSPSKTTTTRNITLKITNPPADGINVSSKEGVDMGANYDAGVMMGTLTTSTTTASIFFSGNRNGNPVYLELPITPSTNAITLDFNIDFKNVDHTIDMPAPNLFISPGSTSTVYCSYSGFRKNGQTDFRNDQAGCTLSALSRSLSSGSTSLRLGYNDGFDAYEFSIYAVNNNTQKSYYKYSNVPPQTYKLLDYTANFSNKSLQSFAFTCSGTYHERISGWVTTTPTGSYSQWNIISPPDGKQNLTNVIAEITKRFPTLKPDTWPYTSSRFFVFLDGTTVDNDIPQGAISRSTEYQVISFY